MRHPITHTAPELLAMGAGRSWPTVWIDGNAGGGIPFGAINSRAELPQLVYGGMRGTQEYADRRDAVMAPTHRPSEAQARAMARYEALISGAVSLGYWAAVGGNAPRVNEYQADLLEAPNTTDPRLNRKIAF